MLTKNMTAQEVFNLGAKHLLTQRAKSQDYNCYHDLECMYRSSSGLKCAVGIFIPDEEYSPDLEHLPLKELWHIIDDDEMPIFSSLMNRHSRLLELLQGIHDHEPLECWQDELEALAGIMNLAFNPRELLAQGEQK